MKKLLCVLIVFGQMVFVDAYSANIKKFVKAGSITFATLTTAVSSDDKTHSTIKAVITRGDLKGAELSGELVEVQGKSKIYMMQYQMIFKSMHFAGIKNPIKIVAYAIDSNAAEEISAANMSHEYLKRNADVFAFSLIQGHSGSWRMMSTDVRSSSLMPVQVRINSGTDIGILFMSFPG